MSMQSLVDSKFADEICKKIKEQIVNELKKNGKFVAPNTWEWGKIPKNLQCVFDEKVLRKLEKMGNEYIPAEDNEDEGEEGIHYAEELAHEAITDFERENYRHIRTEYFDKSGILCAGMKADKKVFYPQK